MHTAALLLLQNIVSACPVAAIICNACVLYACTLLAVLSAAACSSIECGVTEYVAAAAAAAASCLAPDHFKHAAASYTLQLPCWNLILTIKVCAAAPQHLLIIKCLCVQRVSVMLASGL